MIKPELTVAAVVEDNNHFLLVEEYVGGKLVYNQPAGHVEPGESIIDAMVRETREETAWCVEPGALLGIYYWPSTPRGDCVLRCAFSARAKFRDPEPQLDDGIIAAHWLSRAELETLRDQLRSPLVLAAIDAWIAGTRLPLSTIRHMT